MPIASPIKHPTDQPLPFVPSESRLARIQVLNTWQQLDHKDFTQQDAECRVPIEIGAFTTFWQRGLSPATPPFIATASQGARYIIVYLHIPCAVVVYERCGRILTRRAILTDAEQMLAVLPDRALESTPMPKPASPKQLETLRKILDVGEKPFPEISSMMCSRLIDRLLSEKALARIAGEIEACAVDVAQTPTLARD